MGLKTDDISSQITVSDGKGTGDDKKKEKGRDKFRYEQTAPSRFKTGMVPVNALEQKERFLKWGLTPEFELMATPEEVKRLVSQKIGDIKFNLFHEARRIMDSVLKKYKTLDKFVESNYGRRLTVEEAADRVHDYMVTHKLENSLDVIWCSELACSAQMSSSGPDAKANKPELRKYTLLVKSSSENVFLREKGILCLMDHEIGTHYFRSYNDGYQPWYSCRERYKMLSNKSFDTMKTEEGLACVHTLLSSNHKLLCMPALLYYSCCMAEYLSFKQLFDHLKKYVQNPEQRWKHCMRVKRGLKNVNDTGGYGKDQRYFEGAVEILRNVDNIDFTVLMSGKITWPEEERLRRVARTAVVKLPHFMKDMNDYKKQLQFIAKINGLTRPPAKKNLERLSLLKSKGRAQELIKSRQQKTEKMTREQFLSQLRSLELCKELEAQRLNDLSLNTDGCVANNCGCTMFSQKNASKLNKRSSGDNEKQFKNSKGPTMPVLIEVDTMLPIISN